MSEKAADVQRKTFRDLHKNLEKYCSRPLFKHYKKNWLLVSKI